MSGHVVQQMGRSQLPLPALGSLATILVLASFGPNYQLCALSLIVLAVGGLLLWRAGESSILLLTFLFHWLGAAIAVFHANWLNIDVNGYSYYGGEMRSATALALIGILMLAIGMRIGIGAWRARDSSLAREIALRQPLSRWFMLYVVAWCTAFIATTFAWVIPGLSQVLLAIASLKWAFFFIVAYATFASGSLRSPFLPVAFGVELATSLGGYFSDFKTVFFFTIIAALATGIKLSAKSQAILGLLVITLILFGVAWTEVKQEYRDFVSEGQQAQVKTVGYSEGLNKLFDLVEDLDSTKLADGADRLLRRLTYVEFFGLTLQYVPQYLPHENGAILLDAVARPLMPRMFFKDKAIVDDSARTSLYTGGIIKPNAVTSISLGYIAEMYIDFGVMGMMGVLFGLGCLYGLIYRLLLRNNKAGPLLGMALASAVLADIGTLESSVTKIVGSIVVSLLVAWLIVRYAPLYAGWMTGHADPSRTSPLTKLRLRQS